MKILKSQRGAMFGLDARIAMAIVGALSLVGGMAMTMTSSEVKAKALLKDLETYKAAVQSLQYDLKTNLQDAVTTGSEAIKAFQALNDSSVLQAAHQTKWLGPYLKIRTDDPTIHENYGAMRLQIGTDTNVSAASTCGSSCFYWMRVDEVPYIDFMEINDIVDGAGEASPDTSGRVQWRADTGTFPARIFFQSGKVVRG